MDGEEGMIELDQAMATMSMATTAMVTNVATTAAIFPPGEEWWWKRGGGVLPSEGERVKELVGRVVDSTFQKRTTAMSGRDGSERSTRKGGGRERAQCDQGRAAAATAAA